MVDRTSRLMGGDEVGTLGGHVQAAFRCLTRFGAQIDDKVPKSTVIAVSWLPQLKSGLTSAARLPQTSQTKRCSMSDRRRSSGHSSALIAIEWLQR